MSDNLNIGTIDIRIDDFTPCLKSINTGELVDTEVIRIRRKSFLMNQRRPIPIMETPYTIDLRSLLAYAKAKGVDVFNLSEKEKQRFLIPSSQYQQDLSHSVGSH